MRRESTVEGQVTRVSLTRPLTAIQLPPTVQGILAARMDRLPADDKAPLQILAVIGKEFPLSLLTQVVGQPEAEVQGGLAHLQQGEFIYEQPAFPEPEYTFKHALTQDVAYNSLLLERRRALHERTAQAIETLFQDRLEERYHELAHHYSRSGNTAKAVEYLQRAGQQALQRSAYAEAIHHLTAALDPSRPTSAYGAPPAKLVVQTTWARRSLPRGSWGLVAQVYPGARVCQQLGDTPQLFRCCGAWSQFYLVRAEHHTGGRAAPQSGPTQHGSASSWA